MDEATLLEVDKLASLDLDVTGLRAKIAEARELSARASAAREQLFELRPGQKNYDQEISRLSAVFTALEGQQAGAVQDVKDCVKALKLQAVLDEVPKLNHLHDLAQGIDRDIVNAMRKVYDLVQERHGVAQEMDEISGMVRGWAIEAYHHDGMPKGYRNGAFPGHPVWGFHESREAFMTYAKRFSLLSLDGLPQDGEDPLVWFSRRRF